MDSERDIKCYWVIGGTRGGFYPPNIIHICPFKRWSYRYISDDEMKKVIIHEIAHLRYWDKTRDMSFEEREKFVNAKAKESISS